ncbi:MAG: hypothetical protein DWQ07_05255 [Chloroflexi bacterium]|nr:MAG: hypothetical protein DWQ07_05255 [Chloroflexota bacterium]MBL1194841.1 hypothetical protein [Chloroflexota bacterium]
MTAEDAAERVAEWMPDSNVSQDAQPWQPDDLALVFGTVTDSGTLKPGTSDWQLPDLGHPVSSSFRLEELAQPNQEQIAAAQVGGVLDAETQQDLEALQQQAYQEGINAAEAETGNMLSLLRTIVAETQAWQDELFEQSEPVILAMMKQVANTIFAPGVELDPDVLQVALSRAVSQARTLGDLRVHLHPKDAEAVGLLWDEKMASAIGQDVHLISDPSITRGGVFIEGQHGDIDARVESQLASMMKSFDDLVATAEGGQ